jgi:hypothetical protein
MDGLQLLRDIAVAHLLHCSEKDAAMWENEIDQLDKEMALLQAPAISTGLYFNPVQLVVTSFRFGRHTNPQELSWEECQHLDYGV